MAKLYEGQPLNFPIEFYQRKSNLWFFLILMIILAVFFICDLVFQINVNPRRQISDVVKIIFIIFCIGGVVVGIKKLIQIKPKFILYQDKILINRLFKEPNIILWKNINAIRASHDQRATASFERVNAELFECQESIPLQYLKINDTRLNSREVENILRQVFDNAKNKLNKPVVYQKVKLKFWDWY